MNGMDQMSESTEQTSDTAAATSFFERPGVRVETIEVGPGVPLGIEQAANSSVGIGGAYGTWGACCPNAIGFALQEMWDDVRESIPNGKNGDSHSAGNGTALALAERVKKEEAITNYAHCPECKQKTLTQEGGCNVCKACGYSRCD